ncbi:MAG: nuclear transport factor 2 family protein [Acidobacteriota bacterium]
MKRTLLIIAFIMLVASSASARITSRQTSNKVEKEILKLEQARVDAVTKGDTTKLEQMFSDDLVYTHSNARVESKADFLNSVKTGSIRYESMNHSDVTVNVYGNTAVMRGTSDIRVVNAGQSIALKIRFTTVYVKKDGRWQMVAWQSTRLPQS